jgi:ankyrin repeat protein
MVEVDVISLGPDYPAASSDVALHIAVERGFVETCRLLLDAGSDVNRPQRTKQMTPLHFASKMGFSVHRDIVLLLGKHGAKETLDSQGLTPLCVACSSIQRGAGAEPIAAAEALIRALLEIGGEVNPKTTRDGVTPLLRACCFAPIVSPAAPDSDAMLSIVRVLLDAGADVNAATTTSRNTALHLAASRGSIGICQLLLERGADKTATDLGGTNPAEVARRNHHLREATFLEGYDRAGV